MFDAMRSLQKAVYEVLSQDEVLQQQIEGVYDQLPMDAGWPCVVFGQSDARAWSTKTTQGQQIILDLHIFSDAPGRKQALGVLERVASLLHEQQLAMEHLMIVAKRVEQGQIPASAAEEVVQGTIRLRAFLEEV